jgi:hypothetical protein
VALIKTDYEKGRLQPIPNGHPQLATPRVNYFLLVWPWLKLVILSFKVDRHQAKEQLHQLDQLLHSLGPHFRLPEKMFQLLKERSLALNPPVTSRVFLTSSFQNDHTTNIGRHFGVGVEVGPQPQGVLRADVMLQQNQTVQFILDFLDLLNAGKTHWGKVGMEVDFTIRRTITLGTFWSYFVFLDAFCFLSIKFR